MLRSSSFSLLRIVSYTAAVVPAALHAQADHPQANHPAIATRVAEWHQNTLRSAPGQWGVVVADHTGEVIWSTNADEPMMPASTVKLFTTGFARSVLGASARRPTRVTGHGWTEQATGTWIGDWALELNGDPSLERTEGTGPTLYELALQLASS